MPDNHRRAWLAWSRNHDFPHPDTAVLVTLVAIMEEEKTQLSYVNERILKVSVVSDKIIWPDRNGQYNRQRKCTYNQIHSCSWEPHKDVAEPKLKTWHYTQVSGQLHATSCFTHMERAPTTHWTGGWVSPLASLDP